MPMSQDLSWKAVIIILLLAAMGGAMSLLGEKTLGGSLVGGALGYLAQGYQRRGRSGSSGPPEPINYTPSGRIITIVKDPGALMAVVVSGLWAILVWSH